MQTPINRLKSYCDRLEIDSDEWDMFVVQSNSHVIMRVLDRLFTAHDASLYLSLFSGKPPNLQAADSYGLCATDGVVQGAALNGHDALAGDVFPALLAAIQKAKAENGSAMLALEMSAQDGSVASRGMLVLDGGNWLSGAIVIGPDADPEPVLGFSPDVVRDLVPELVQVGGRGRTLLDDARFAEVSGIGAVPGRDLYDILAVSYGDEVTIRLRYELTQKKDWFRPPAGWPLERAVRYLVDAVERGWQLPRPEMAFYRGQQAKQFMRSFINRANSATEIKERELAPNGEVRIWTDIPERHQMN